MPSPFIVIPPTFSPITLGSDVVELISPCFAQSLNADRGQLPRRLPEPIFRGCFHHLQDARVGAFSPVETSGICQSRPGSALVGSFCEADAAPVNSSRARVRSRSFGRARPSLRAISRARSSIICGVTRAHSFGSTKDSFRLVGPCFIHSVYSEFVLNPTRGWLPIRMHMFNLFAHQRKKSATHLGGAPLCRAKDALVNNFNKLRIAGADHPSA